MDLPRIASPLETSTTPSERTMDEIVNPSLANSSDDDTDCCLSCFSGSSVTQAAEAYIPTRTLQSTDVCIQTDSPQERVASIASQPRLTEEYKKNEIGSERSLDGPRIPRAQELQPRMRHPGSPRLTRNLGVDRGRQTESNESFKRRTQSVPILTPPMPLTSTDDIRTPSGSMYCTVQQRPMQQCIPQNFLRPRSPYQQHFLTQSAFLPQPTHSVAISNLPTWPPNVTQGWLTYFASQ